MTNGFQYAITQYLLAILSSAYYVQLTRRLYAIKTILGVKWGFYTQSVPL